MKLLLHTYRNFYPSLFNSFLRLSAGVLGKRSFSFGFLFVLCFLSFFVLISKKSFSQVLNNGVIIGNYNDSVKINSDVIHRFDGYIKNQGNFYVSGDWINDNPINSIFTTGQNGWVHLDGGIQTIKGNTISHFNNLELSGTGSKKLKNIDTEIEDSLALNNIEFAADINTVFVLSSAVNIVTQTTQDGFVSSKTDGGLSRNTKSTSTYFFPVGHINNTGIGVFRPIEITPNSSSLNTFKVRMAGIDPINLAFYDGYNRNSKEAGMGDINPKFYHRIYRTNGSSAADLTIFYDSILDFDFDVIAQWNNAQQWGNLGEVSKTANYALSGLTKAAFDDFSSIPFALSSEVSASVYVPNIFSPNGDGFNDLLFVRGKGIVELKFTIFDRWGERVFETTDITKGWDGIYKGETMNLAVFVYMVSGKFKNGDLIDKKGNFTLLR